MFGDDLFALPFAGVELDRATEVRKDAAALAARWHNGGLVVMIEGRNRVAVTPDGAAGWVPTRMLDGAVARDAIFLGDRSDAPLFAVDAGLLPGAARPEGLEFVAFRDAALGFGRSDQSAVAAAVALVTWHDGARYCPNCGTATRTAEGGHIRICDACGRSHFPRSDAAVIMLVHDGDFCVLGRRIGSATNRWSTLAGFVEAGESPEAAVWREVYEESGLRVDQLRYRGSQPWPFPSSLMLAYEATSQRTEIRCSEEHHEVRWFHRDEVAEAIAAGEMAVPSSLSAGGHLISSWLSRAENTASDDKGARAKGE